MKALSVIGIGKLGLPLAACLVKKVLGEGVRYASSVEECLKGAEFCVLATPWDEFKNIRSEDFRKGMKKPVLLDCWRIFNRAEFSQKLEYLAIGLDSVC